MRSSPAFQSSCLRSANGNSRRRDWSFPEACRRIPKTSRPKPSLRTTRIGPGFIIHNFSSVLIDAESIGADFTVNQAVSVGPDWSGGARPRIGDNVYFGAGAKALGDITIGTVRRIEPPISGWHAVSRPPFEGAEYRVIGEQRRSIVHGSALNGIAKAI